MDLVEVDCVDREATSAICDFLPDRIGTFLTSYGLEVALHSIYAHGDAVNELYKKGCQEKTSPLTGGRGDLCLDIQPTVCTSVPCFGQGFCSGWFFLRLVFSAGSDNANRV